MARPFSYLFLVWALLIGPALCAGGLFEHACDCGDEEAVECHHEDACPDDPCASLVRTGETDAQPRFDFAGPLLIPVAILSLTVELASVSWSWSLAPPLPPDRWKLPFALSDRPQLI